jgi:hypothetical protein
LVLARHVDSDRITRQYGNLLILLKYLFGMMAVFQDLGKWV